jgi:hypothetical protein
MLPSARPVPAFASLQPPLDRARLPAGNCDGVGRWSGGQTVIALLFRKRLHPDIELCYSGALRRWPASPDWLHSRKGGAGIVVAFRVERGEMADREAPS